MLDTGSHPAAPEAPERAQAAKQIMATQRLRPFRGKSTSKQRSRPTRTALSVNRTGMELKSRDPKPGAVRQKPNSASK